MWVLPTRGRPERCQEVIDACAATGMSTGCWVWVDGWDDGYRDLRLPPNFALTATMERHELVGVLQGFFEMRRRLPWYGLLCDDTLPRTPGWDRRLVEAAGRWRIAHPEDLYNRNIGIGVCFGGELVRALGGFCSPGAVHFVDVWWSHAAAALGVEAFLPDVVVEHMHFSNGKRPMDGTDRRVFRGREFAREELAAFDAWKRGPECAALLGRARDLMEKEALP